MGSVLICQKNLENELSEFFGSNENLYSNIFHQVRMFCAVCGICERLKTIGNAMNGTVQDIINVEVYQDA